MTRSTRHKSSKHKDATKDYSDSEKESSLKEKKKNNEEISVRVSKESGSGDKRKGYYDSIDGEYYEEYTSSSSKRRKGKSGSDRWNGKDDEKGESSKKTKASSEKSRRREEVEGEEDTKKKCNGKSDGKHRESSRRESRDFDKEKDREKDSKYKEGKSDKFYDGGDQHKSKANSDKTESKAEGHVTNPGTENYSLKRSRHKRDDHGTGDKHQDISDDVIDRLFTSGDDYIKDRKQKEDKIRGKYREDEDEDIKHKGEKQRDDRSTKEHPKSDEKLHRDESKRKSKFRDTAHGHDPDSDLDGYHDRERNWDYERESDRNERVRDRDYERDRDRDRDQERDRRDYEHDRYDERHWDRDRGRYRDRDHDRDMTHNREKDRSHDYYHDGKRGKNDRERDSDSDVVRLDDQSGRYKDRREGKRSPDYQDFQDAIMAARSGRTEPHGDMIRSERQPWSSVGYEENGIVSDQITKGVSSREAAELSGGSERVTRQKASEKTAKMEDGVLGEFPVERSFATKASPRPMVERSNSSNSLDRRYNDRSSARRNLEVEETGHRNNPRDFSAVEEERLLVDESSQAELPFSNRTNQTNSSFPPRPESRSGISSPRVGPRDEDNRVNTGGRHKRVIDAMMGRGQGNVWRGVPSWPSPLPNGFIPFQHVPPHGGFQTMMAQFPSPSLYAVRPSVEMNHQGIPYHISDAERFSGHMRPLGWQNMMDSSGASHMHGYFGDMSNGVFRDGSNMYGGSEWDHNRRMQGRGWEPGADEWKTRNRDATMEISSMSVKDDNSAQVADDDSLGGQTSHSENNRAKSVEAGSNLTSSAKELHASSPKVMEEVAAEDPGTETIDNTERYRQHYLSKLDISVALADPELHKCINFLLGEERLTIDDGTEVFVNLKEGGKRVSKSNITSLKALSLFPSQNSSVFQIAMDLYKEQRFEIKGLPNVENHMPPQISPSKLVKIDNKDDVDGAMKANSPMDTVDVKMAEVSDSEAFREEVVSHVGSKMEIEPQEKVCSSPNPDKSPEALNEIEDCAKDLKPDDGGSLDHRTMETAMEHDGVSEGDHVTMTIASPAVVAMDVDDRKESDDGEKSVIVGNDVSQKKVTETLVNESDESVISRIHHSPQSTH